MKFLVILVQIFFLVHPHPGGRHYLLEVAGGKRYLVESGSNNNLVQNRGKVHLQNGGKNYLVQNEDNNYLVQNGGEHYLVEVAQNASSPNENLHNKA